MIVDYAKGGVKSYARVCGVCLLACIHVCVCVCVCASECVSECVCAYVVV